MQPRWPTLVLSCFLTAAAWYPCLSQDTGSARGANPQMNRKWSISLNPLSILELQSAAGIGIGYRFNEHWEIWSESSLLFPGLYYQTYPHLKGAREILQLKYYFGPRKETFVGLDARWKHYAYNDSFDFYNPSTGGTLRNAGYRLGHSIPGGAFIMGQRIKLSGNDHFFLEMTVGVGFKYRTVAWNNTLPGYLHTRVNERLDTFPFTSGNHTPCLLLYFPAAFRLYYVF